MPHLAHTRSNVFCDGAARRKCRHVSVDVAYPSQDKAQAVYVGVTDYHHRTRRCVLVFDKIKRPLRRYTLKDSFLKLIIPVMPKHRGYFLYSFTIDLNYATI